MSSTGSTGAAGDGARVSVFVAVAPADAFAVFTEETDLWWRRGPAYRMAGRSPGVLAFEGGAGGRLFETSDGRTLEIGRVLVWEPPVRLAFEWRGIAFAPGESTRVDVEFVAREGGTMVTVHHRGWSALRDDHPARHGNLGSAMDRMVGMWWSALMTSLREHVGAATRA